MARMWGLASRGCLAGGPLRPSRLFQALEGELEAPAQPVAGADVVGGEAGAVERGDQDHPAGVCPNVCVIPDVVD
jgi:hypothetical protein